MAVAAGGGLLLDAKDQSPTIFLMALPGPFRAIGNIILTPCFHFGERVIRDATALSPMAGMFLLWAANFAGRPVAPDDRVAPLTAASGQFSAAELEAARQWWDGRGILVDGGPGACFVGNHSPAFKFVLVAKGLR